MLKKGLVIGIILLFIGMSVSSSIGSIRENDDIEISKINEAISDEILTVDNDIEYWALLISAGVYAGFPDENLPGAHEGPEFLRKKLLVSEHWKNENIKVITNKSASLLNIIRGFRWLDNREDENDISLVYIFTHGGPLERDKWPKDEWDGKDEILITYLGGIFRFTNLRDDALNFLLSRLESKGVCVIIESCYSGGFNDTPYTKAQRNDIKMDAEKYTHEFAGELSQSGRVILMSCSENETSGGLIFTFFLIEGFAGFADTNNDDLVSTMPIRHWTDSKIRCHLFSCVVALAYLRRLELKLTACGIKRTAEDVMDDMRHLHCVLTVSKGARKPVRRLETPSKTQAEVLKALGHYIDESGVLQALIR